MLTPVLFQTNVVTADLSDKMQSIIDEADKFGVYNPVGGPIQVKVFQ